MSITPTRAEARKSLQARLLLLCLDAKCVAAVHHRDQLVPPLVSLSLSHFRHQWHRLTTFQTRGDSNSSPRLQK